MIHSHVINGKLYYLTPVVGSARECKEKTEKSVIALSPVNRTVSFITTWCVFLTFIPSIFGLSSTFTLALYGVFILSSLLTYLVFEMMFRRQGECSYGRISSPSIQIIRKDDEKVLTILSPDSALAPRITREEVFAIPLIPLSIYRVAVSYSIISHEALGRLIPSLELRARSPKK